MQLTLLMNFAERHRRWLYLAILLLIPMVTILFASSQANAATGINSIFGNDDWKRSPAQFRDNVPNDRCSYLAMCRWGTVMALPSASSLIAINPLMFLGSISSLIFVCVAFFAAMVLQFILFLTNSSFLGSLSYFVDGVFATFITSISADRPVGTAGGIFGNAPLLLIVVAMLLVFFVFTYITTIIRGNPGFGRKMFTGILSISALMIISYQAQGNHSETVKFSNNPSAMATVGNQATTQAESGAVGSDGKKKTAAVDPSDPKNWNIASPGWVLAWGGRGASIATDLVSSTIDGIKTAGGLISTSTPSIGAGMTPQDGVVDQCAIYIQNMHSVLQESGSSGVFGNSNKIAVAYDDLLVSFILNPYTISKYGPPSKTMTNSYCRDMENRANTPPGQQVLIMSETNMYGVNTGFLRNDGDKVERPLTVSKDDLSWNTAGYRISDANGNTHNPDNTNGSGDGNGGKYWDSPVHVAARAFSPNLADVAGGGKSNPNEAGGDIKSGGLNNSRENANKYWFAACLWSPTGNTMVRNDEWAGVNKAKGGVTGETGDSKPLFSDSDAGCHSSAIIGDTFNDNVFANSSGYFAEAFSFKEPVDWLDGINKALFGRSAPSVATARVFSNATGGTAGPASTYYLSTNGFDPSSNLPFVVISLALTIASFKFIMPLFMGSFISQAIAILALCMTPVLLLLSGFGINYISQLTRKVLGMVVTAFLTFAVLVGVIQAAAALADVFRKVLYSPWHPVLFQVLEMGLAGILAMTAVKMFVANAMNIKTTNMREAIGSAVGFSTGQQKLGNMFKRSNDASASSSAMGKVKQAASATRSTLAQGATSAVLGKMFGRDDKGQANNPLNKMKTGAESAVNKIINPNGAEATKKKPATEALTTEAKLTNGDLINNVGADGKPIVDPSLINAKTPDKEFAGLSPDKMKARTDAEKTVGLQAPIGVKGIDKAEDIKAKFADIQKNAEVNGFGKETPLLERHITMGANGPVRPMDLASMTPDQKKAYQEGRLDHAVDGNGANGDRVSFGSQIKNQDAYLPDPATGINLPKALVESGTAFAGDVNQNGITIDGAMRGENGIWKVQKFVDPTSPAMGVLQNPAPEGFAHPDAWTDAGALHQWMTSQGIDASNIDTSTWPAERMAQLENFQKHSDSIYTALGSDLPTFTPGDISRNSKSAPGFQATSIPLDAFDAFESGAATDSRTAFADMTRELAALGTTQDAKISQLIKEKTQDIIGKRKDRFEREATEMSSLFDKRIEQEEANAGPSIFLEQMGLMFDNAKKNGATENELAGLKGYAESLTNGVEQSGSVESAEQAIKRLAEAFHNSGTGDADAIAGLADQMTDKLKEVRKRTTGARDRQINDLEARFRSDIDGIQSKARIDAERETQFMYDSVMGRAKEEAFTGNKGTKTRTQAILNWFPTLFEGNKEK